MMKSQTCIIKIGYVWSCVMKERLMCHIDNDDQHVLYSDRWYGSCIKMMTCQKKRWRAWNVWWYARKARLTIRFVTIIYHNLHDENQKCIMISRIWMMIWRIWMMIWRIFLRVHEIYECWYSMVRAFKASYTFRFFLVPQNNFYALNLNLNFDLNFKFT